MEKTIPTPIPAGSPKLRDRRYHVDVHGPRNERGAYPFIVEGLPRPDSVSARYSELADLVLVTVVRPLEEEPDA